MILGAAAALFLLPSKRAGLGVDHGLRTLSIPGAVDHLAEDAGRLGLETLIQVLRERV